MDTALQTLLLAAGLAAPSLPPAPAARGRAAAPSPVVEIARLPVASIAAAQAGAAAERSVGGRAVRLTAAFDFDGDSWLKLSSGGQTRAAALSALQAGTDLPVGGLPLRVSARGDALTLESGGASVQLSYGSLVDALFKAARHVKPHEVLDYAVAVEDGGDGVPASVCLIRRDGQGVYWVTFRKPEQLRRPQWFAAVNGVLKGFVAEGADLVFVEKKIDGLSAYSAEGAALGPELLQERRVLVP